jgi:hypothetical protein
MNVLVLRPPQVPTRLYEKCTSLCQTIKYQKNKNDCLTVIADLFEEFGWWQLYFIASMPQVLLAEHGFRITQGMEAGDLVFYTRKGLITHVSVAVSNKRVFHNSKEVGGGEIEKLKRLLARPMPESQQPMYSLLEESKDFYQIDPRSYRGRLYATLFRQNITLAWHSVIQLLLSQRRVCNVSISILKSSCRKGESPPEGKRISHVVRT